MLSSGPWEVYLEAMKRVEGTSFDADWSVSR